MIYLLCPGSSEEAAAIVSAALQRSCGRAQVCRITPAHWVSRLEHDLPGILVVVNPPDVWSDLVVRTLQATHSKVIVFGALPSTLAQYLGAQTQPMTEAMLAAAQCQPATSVGGAESLLRVQYAHTQEFIRSPLVDRPFLRYDFADEWNNLGYGAIRVDDSIWAMCQWVELPKKNCLAHVTLQGHSLGAYAGFWVNSLLWFNRPVGPVDSQEWRIVETYLAHYAWPERSCQPVLSEVPHGFDAAVTMRLDCDEDIESARRLWQTYQELSIPFSLAVHTKVLADERHHALIREVLAHGGAILSHTATHAPNWGGNYDAAFHEATTSAAHIKKVTDQPVRYAVSPFHQTPPYARAALADAGYQGCIGGIIRNDPDFLMARSGVAPISSEGFVGHSQQCMLHGDCMLHGPDPLAVYKYAFDLARNSHTFFAYLDHPFSERYQYGWNTEKQRMQAHVDFIGHMQASGKVLFANEDDALDFLQYRAQVVVQSELTGFKVQPQATQRSKWLLAVEYAEQSYAVPNEGIAL
jgi:peptidoglycan/xylan/chitin deacetylase (PgdA/CDA1 family)